jgi:hypothetical protein
LINLLAGFRIKKYVVTNSIKTFINGLIMNKEVYTGNSDVTAKLLKNIKYFELELSTIKTLL